MARRRKARKGAPGGWVWTGLACALCLAIGVVIGALWSPFGERRPPAVSGRAAVEAVVGELEPGGVHLRVQDGPAAERLLGRIRAAAERGGGTLAAARRAPGRITASLRVDGRTYPLSIGWSRPPETAPPMLAVVIDDMGRDLERARAFLDLPIPITPSVIPHLRHSRDVAALARSRGRLVLLHLPMEPKRYPQIDPGPGALLAGMDEAEVRRRVAADLAQVPGAAGVNNHMGSRLTELDEPMGWVMEELRDRGLFFLDSLTTARSVAASKAREAGIPTLRRDVFLDNDRTEKAIGRQLRRALDRALRTGRAVAIGHPYPVTLETLRKWAPRIRAAGVKAVPLDALLGRGER